MPQHEQQQSLPIALTVDVEDYFQVSAFERCIARDEWESWPQRVELNTDRVLDLFARHNLLGTFFILGWVAERFPGMVRRIADAGHEIACHGYGHTRITAMSREEFRADIRRAKSILENLTGVQILGYRAPSYTITARTLWALDELIDAGFVYDSSIFPIRHDIYGMPDANRLPHTIIRENGSIREFPPTTFPLTVFGKKRNLPVAGGGYLRLLPVSWISSAFTTLLRKGDPCLLYFHPWEVDPGQPRVRAPLKSRFRHYLNLDKTVGKLDYLFSRHRFAPMRHVLDEVFAHE